MILREWLRIVSSTSALFVALAASAATTVPVNLAPYFSLHGIFTDGTTVTNSGLGDALAYSATGLGTSVTWNGVTFNLGPVNQANVVPGGTVVALPAGNYTTLNILASRQFGTAAGETFTVVYSDGSQHTYTQGMSDWWLGQTAGSPLTGPVVAAPQPFESTVVLQSYIRSGGGNKTEVNGLFGYAFPLDPSRVPSQLILPKDTDVSVFAVTLTGQAATAATTAVSLASAYNSDAMFSNGTAVANGGFDGEGNAYSATLLGSSVTFNGIVFPLGPANAPDAVDNAKIVLPAGSYSALNILAASSFGARTGALVVTYSDGTTATFTQTFSDWWRPVPTVAQAGESIAVAMPYFEGGSKTQTETNFTFDLYEYSFALNPAKTVASVTLPSDPYVKLFSAVLSAVPAAVAPVRPVNLDPYFNVPAISTDPSTAKNSLYNVGPATYTYSESTLGNSLTWNGTTFILGAPNVNNAVSNVTVPLPAGSFGRLDVLGSRSYAGNAAEKFVVTYTDGTTSTFTQGMSYWWNNGLGTANYPGESTAAFLPYLHDGASGSMMQPVSLFGYSFALNAAKVVKSVTLPADPNVGVLAMNLGPANVAPTIPSEGTAQSVVTHHNDTWRTGSNTGEYQLTPATVGNIAGTNLFGRLGTITLDEQVDAQPLVVPNISVAGDPHAGTHDVVYVATENNTVYAIDPAHLTILAQRNLGAAVPTPLGCSNNSAVVGINSTPVIDTTKGVIYVMAYVKTSANGPQYLLHAMSLTTLADVVAPVTVAASAKLNNGATFTFNATYQRQRPALLESGGLILAAFGSFCDFAGQNSRGWVLGFNSSTLALNTAGVDLVDKLAGSTSAVYYLSAVWMSGSGPAVDEAGNVYFTTGNSDTGTYDGVNSIQESVVKEAPGTGQLLGLFTPGNLTYLDDEDVDVGSSGVVLLPNASKPVGAVLSKDGLLRVFGRTVPGGNSDAALQTATPAGACWCGLTYFNDGQDRLVSSGGTLAQLYTWQTGTEPGLLLQGIGEMPTSGQDVGAFTSLSAGGTANGILWSVPKPFVFGSAALNLMAFQASPVNGTLPLLYVAPAGSWINGGANANIVPTVANGRVYVASYKQLAIFGFGGTR
jgi:hypothetical protein